MQQGMQMEIIMKIHVIVEFCPQLSDSFTEDILLLSVKVVEDGFLAL